MEQNGIESILPVKFRGYMREPGLHMDRLRELRFRIGQPVEVLDDGRHMLCTERVERADLKEMLAYISGYSLYAFEEEIAQGFITIPGGHRVGVAGRTVVERGNIRNIRNISFVNIRLSHEVIGCGEKVMPYLGTGGRLKNALLISPPGCGKTTLLRDLVRILSGTAEGLGKSVAVVDERSEIAGSYLGVPQNDVGCRTDVLDGCPKSEGMMMAVRSLSPEVLVVDEIGGRKDVQALAYAMNCGCAVIATAHGESFEEIRDKPEVGNIVKQKLFDRYVILKHTGGPGRIGEIRDGEGRCLYCG